MFFFYYFLIGFFFAAATWWIIEVQIKQKARKFDDVDWMIIFGIWVLWPLVVTLTIIYWEKIQARAAELREDDDE